ncbi:MAG: hypothetical protein C5B51_18095 [Terriglobia bacterium]|nr:MAG: hypothetical protein C5B51_18095 [Terriglobia bacterium]
MYVFLALTLAAAAFGAPAPLPTNLLGVQTINNIQLPNPICISGECGGAFQAGVGGASPLATLWCVDSQEFVSLGQTYTANIVLLSDSTKMGDGTQVRYGNVTGNAGNTSQTDASPGNWDFDIHDAFNSYNTALSRYTLAAFLISQYTPTPQGPADTAQNEAIQRAVWRIMSNTNAHLAAQINTGLNLGGGDISTGVPANGNWVAYAEAQLHANPNLINLNGWAVVSGAYANGNLLNGANAIQTYLVQVAVPVPEPGFFALLALGVAGVVTKARRRK